MRVIVVIMKPLFNSFTNIVVPFISTIISNPYYNTRNWLRRKPMFSDLLKLIAMFAEIFNSYGEGTDPP